MVPTISPTPCWRWAGRSSCCRSGSCFAAATQQAGAINRGDVSLLPRLSGLRAFVDVLGFGPAASGGTPIWHMLLVSFAMALAIALGKIAISVLSAFAVVFFRFPGRKIAFWMIFITLMLPVEVRIIPTYAVMSDFHLINTFTGLTMPLIASATATLLFRQVFLAIPDETGGGRRNGRRRADAVL